MAPVSPKGSCPLRLPPSLQSGGRHFIQAGQPKQLSSWTQRRVQEECMTREDQAEVIGRLASGCSLCWNWDPEKDGGLGHLLVL